MVPVLYSFRRCPFAIRARMALWYAGIAVEHREVLLSNKPQAMLDASPKGTVPILVLADAGILEESRDIMRWALGKHDPQSWWCDVHAEAIDELIDENDLSFKLHIDRYKYSDRFPERPKSDYRSEGEGFLRNLERRLANQSFLLGKHVTMADVALFPFVRQFAMVDSQWFEHAPYPELQKWLREFIASSLFLNVMTKLKPWNADDRPLFVDPGLTDSAER